MQCPRRRRRRVLKKPGIFINELSKDIIMNQNDLIHHHRHVRKRVHKNLETYPHPDKIKRALDKIIYFYATIMPIFTSTQVYKIYSTKSADGVSLIAWSAYLFGTMLWLTYGIVHKEKPIIYSNIINATINLLVVIGTVLYT